MKVAVPEYQGRIAPVFDCCRRILIVVQNEHEEEVIIEEDWSMVPRLARPPRLKELVVQCVLCGGISCWMEEQIRERNIRIIPWISGDLWEVMKAFRNGVIHDQRYAMPGRGACRRTRLGYQDNKKCLRNSGKEQTYAGI
jgi:hypothetical protein